MHYIKIPDNIKTVLYDEFKKYVNTHKFAGNVVDFETNLNNTVNLPKANLFITLKAYTKMMLYVRDTATEIAWHGTVSRTINKDGIATYLIHDVMLYPQIVSHATVDTDQEKYQEWLINLDDNTANTLRMQGHSHVNFAARPSGTDTNFYEDILATVPKDEYYIFLILNKSGDLYKLIYDLKQNLVYEDEDINFEVADETNLHYLNTINNEKETYCPKPTYTSDFFNDKYPYPYNYANSKKSLNNNKHLTNDDDDDDDDNDEFFGRYGTPLYNYTKQNKKKGKRK